jgi:glycosyltransferase involved in cell wall biosynthesis
LDLGLSSEEAAMTFAKPSVSVIIPVYNGAKFLSEAVESIRRQNYHPLEIIIVDDGSTDETAALVASLGEDIRYVYQRNRGPAAARNTGLAMARGDVIAFLDADDYWPPNKLKIQLARLNDNPKIEVVLGRVQYTGLFTALERKIQFEGPDNTLINVHLGSGIFRKSVFDKVGVFDETLRFYEDHDWFLRVREQGISMVIIGQTTLHYRLHEHNMSRHKDIAEFNIAKVLKKSLDRRRQQNNGLVPSLPKFFDFDEVKVSHNK